MFRKLFVLIFIFTLQGCGETETERQTREFCSDFSSMARATTNVDKVKESSEILQKAAVLADKYKAADPLVTNVWSEYASVFKEVNEASSFSNFLFTDGADIITSTITDGLSGAVNGIKKTYEHGKEKSEKFSKKIDEMNQRVDVALSICKSLR